MSREGDRLSGIEPLERHWSERQWRGSSGHLWFGPSGIAMGARVPMARLRPPRLRTVRPSSRQIRHPSRPSSRCSRPSHGLQANHCRAVDSRTAAVHRTTPSAARATWCPQAGPAAAGRYADRSWPGHRPAAGCSSVVLLCHGPVHSSSPCTGLQKGSQAHSNAWRSPAAIPSISFSASMCSASIFLSLAFSASRAFSLLARTLPCPYTSNATCRTCHR